MKNNNFQLRGKLQQNYSLAGYTSWRVGGAAKLFYQPADTDDLVLFLQLWQPNEKIIWLGGGNNVLIRDGGIDGTVICTAGTLDQIERIGEINVYAAAGIACAKLAKYCQQNNLIGAEFLAGIPGTVGGALAMNAGAFDSEIWDYVVAVKTIDRKGNIKTKQPADFVIGYRSLKSAEEEWFISAEFFFTKGDEFSSNEKMHRFTEKRFASQPIGKLTCGSVFRNPPNDYAARLIEACSLKGVSIGGAAVSTKHANFIINDGNATSTDIENLINLIKKNVAEKFGVELIPEVRIMGENT